MTTITVNIKNLRNKLIYFLLKEGIDARPMINPVHQAYHFKKIFNNKNFKNSINISKNSMHLPSSTSLKKSEIKFICSKVKLFSVKVFDCTAWINRNFWQNYVQNVYKSKEHIVISCKEDFLKSISKINNAIVIDCLPNNRKALDKKVF